MATDTDSCLAKRDTIIKLPAQSRKRSPEAPMTSVAALLGYPTMKKPEEKATLQLFLGHNLTYPKDLVSSSAPTLQWIWLLGN